LSNRKIDEVKFCWTGEIFFEEILPRPEIPYNERCFMDQVQFLAVSIILFLLGIWGIFLNRKNIIIMLMSIELMLLAVNLNFLLFSVYLDDLIGQMFALLILTVAAAESAIGLALLVVYYRVRGTISVEFINLMKG
jgi:NADH-quinone oxidoreductase subunit K